MGKNCIVVPLYKPLDSLGEDELLSLCQLYKVLGKHAIYLVGPSSLEWDKYTRHAEGMGCSVKIHVFEDAFFRDIAGYNQLLLSGSFYSAFSGYDYMLIYQTDAFVFEDQLEYWCSAGFDYIGAPWFQGWTESHAEARIIGVGNGGFSLRNIRSSRKTLARLRAVEKIWRFYRGSSVKKWIHFARFLSLFKWLYPVKPDTEIFNILFLKGDSINEDAIWGQYIPQVFPSFKIAPAEAAIRFSFEVNPAVLYEMNGRRLPFGCHAWKRYDSAFWQEYIQ